VAKPNLNGLIRLGPHVLVISLLVILFVACFPSAYSELQNTTRNRYCPIDNVYTRH